MKRNNLYETNDIRMIMRLCKKNLYLYCIVKTEEEYNLRSKIIFKNYPITIITKYPISMKIESICENWKIRHKSSLYGLERIAPLAILFGSKLFIPNNYNKLLLELREKTQTKICQIIESEMR